MELSNISEKFSQGLGGAFALAMIAFSIVFLVLMALTFIIFATRYLANASGLKTTPPAPTQAKPTQSAAPAGTDKNIIAAVIAAAVAASGGGRATSIRPLSVTNRGKASPWKTAGRMDLVEGFD
ncbi:MAG: OadG family protein [Thermovirgaceae bacterium]|nr:OadG family protein [Thermovirgaceae bacterium]